MATIQAKTCRGHKYWQIVESRRVNGKPRPIVLAHLGKPLDLLRRLQGLTGPLKVKSYAHGAVAALLKLTEQLQIPQLINQHVRAQRTYFPDKPLRHGLTAGITLVLAAIGRACQCTSKRGWWAWAKTTSCEFLLRVALSKLDSQHFWDMMDCLPPEAIPEIEGELLERIRCQYRLAGDTLAFDTTNFYTFIATTNGRCTMAQRTKSKQKRHDLRSIGMALVVTRDDLVPLFHETYQGNRNDTKVFAELSGRIKRRLEQLGMDVEKHTLVFDRGNNSKTNLARLARQHWHYVGALRPCDHKQLVADAEGSFQDTEIDGITVRVYRDRREIWGTQRTVVMLISERLKNGQLHGIYETLDKKKAELRRLQRDLANPKARAHTREQLEEKVEALLRGQYMDGLLSYRLEEREPAGHFALYYRTERKVLEELEDRLGLRILMTDRHDWATADIIQAYYSQATVERVFRSLKDPHHLGMRPQFHWTDQKIRVHFFTCILGFQLAALMWKTVREKLGWSGTPNSLIEALSQVRLATLVEDTGKRGRPRAIHQLEEMEPELKALVEALDIAETHHDRPRIEGVGVYS